MTQRTSRQPYCWTVATITRSYDIAASPQAVWDVLADFGAISSWAPNVDHSCLLDHGPDVTAAGTTRRVQAGRNTLVERITESAAPNVLAYDIEGLPRWLGRISNRRDLTGRGGRTSVRLTSSVTDTNPVTRIAARGLCRIMARQSVTMLTGLAARVESTR